VRIGSLYAGTGGLDLAAEWALDAETVWQLDLVGAAMRQRHWPDALQVETDVSTVDPLSLPPIDALIGGFSCKGVSCAGRGELLGHPMTRTTYEGLLRFADVLRPGLIVIENTPVMLTAMRELMERDYGALGYVLTWVRCGAWDAGAPHIRRRVFVVAEQAAVGRGVLDAPAAGRWSPVESERIWGTPRVGNGGHGGEREDDRGRIEDQVRTWPTPTSRDEKSAGGLAHTKGGTCLNDEAAQVRTWPTVAAGDYLGAAPNQNTVTLGREIRQSEGKRLRPEWVEVLMGFPQGWTLPEGEQLGAERDPRWPRGRYPADWDRSQLWPGFDWEPSRTLPDGPPCRGRPARIRAMGNAVCPQQGALAIRTALQPTQGQLF